ncbi:MAG: DUF4199 domain-containing protein [Candidatus Cryptobacteroides sp.]|nr:DUF4199 domain-containing protein [Bacteroidales bacterium]MDY3963368.1 DUF4199 domain-containing protein [Candidatus Cryptobacteroides sp.]
MENTNIVDRHALWNEGSKYGLYLGAATGIFIFLNMFTASMAGGSAGLKMLAVALNAGLWLLKFLGCLWLMRFFMLRFVMDHPSADNRHTFRLGVITAMTSALVYSGINLLNICVISPDSIKEAVDTLMQTYTSIGALSDSEMIAVEKMMGWYPQIAFFSNFIYCFIYGTVVSLIFSGSIPPKDIFAENRNDDNRAGN